MTELNFPNSLTLIRVSLIPILVLVYYIPMPYSSEFATLIFVLASITDWLDGYLARKLNQETKFGAFCDPVADKLIVVIALMLVLEKYCSYLITLPAIIIVGRELIISGLREWMASQGLSSVTSVQYVGKIKTLAQMFAIGFLLYGKIILDFDTKSIGIVLLFVAAVLTLWSMFIYLYNAWKVLSKGFN